MNSFKEKCVELRKKDYSLLEIARMLKRPKTSVYFHVKSIPLSLRKQREIYVAAGERIAPFARGRKGKSAKPFKPFSRWTSTLVSLIAHLMFDGEIGERGCVYNNRSVVLVSNTEKSMRLLYDFEPKRYTNPVTGVLRISYHNVALANYCKGKAAQLIRDIHSLPMEQKRAFVRAFFDDEAYMEFRPETKKRRIRGYQKNIQILLLIKELLAYFGIEARIQQPNEVVVSGKKDLMRFQKEINFSDGLYMNGKRSNSIWKKDVEKRKLLQEAISSYQ